MIIFIFIPCVLISASGLKIQVESFTAGYAYNSLFSYFKTDGFLEDVQPGRTSKTGKFTKQYGDFWIEFLTSQKQIKSTLEEMKVKIDFPDVKPAIQKLNFIKGLWIEVLAAEENDEFNVEYLKERLFDYVFDMQNGLMNALDKLNDWYEKGHVLFGNYVAKSKSVMCDDSQSQLWHFQEFIQRLHNIQEDAYHFYHYAFRKKNNTELFRREPTYVLSTWENRKSLQSIRNRDLSYDTTAVFCSQTKSIEGPIRSFRFCLATSLCRAHFFNLSGIEKNSRGIYQNLRMDCYESEGHMKIHPPFHEKNCKDFIKGYATRWISRNTLKVSDFDSQFICRLQFYEEIFTDVPLLRVKADICNKHNHSHLEFLKTIKSDSENYQSISWPYQIEPNFRMPYQLGYVIGVQLDSIDTKLVIRFLTAHRQTKSLKNFIQVLESDSRLVK